MRCDLGPVDNPDDPPCVRCRRESKECYFDTVSREKKDAGDDDDGSEAGDQLIYDERQIEDDRQALIERVRLAESDRRQSAIEELAREASRERRRQAVTVAVGPESVDKTPRLYSVPKSKWRLEQDQKLRQAREDGPSPSHRSPQQAVMPSSVPMNHLGLGPQDIATPGKHQQLVHAQARANHGPAKRAMTDDEDFVDPPPLPEGWIAHLDNSSGQYYYIHLATQSTQWEFPQGPNPLSDEDRAAALQREVFRKLD